MQGLRDVLDGWVYTTLGADAFAFVGAHPWIYAVVLAAVLAGSLAGFAMALRRFRRWREAIWVFTSLAWSANGRQCLRSAWAIRRGAGRLRHSIRREIDDRFERRALLSHLHRFTRSELPQVLRQAVHLVRTADDRREHQLRGELAWQGEAWSAATDDGERERLQQAIARTRQQLATVAPLNEARTRHVQALAEAAAAVQALEIELTTLGLARAQNLPAFRDHLHEAARNLADLRQAYRELEADPARRP